MARRHGAVRDACLELMERLCYTRQFRHRARRHAGENAGKHGYLPRRERLQERHADIYTTAKANGERATFVMRACLGVHSARSMRLRLRCSQRRAHPSALTAGAHFDSVRAITRASGGSVDYPEFMVYKST